MRQDDEKDSAIISNLLYEKVYSNYFDKFIPITTNVDLQIRGVDVVALKGNKIYCIDEKATIRWLNLKTFALELEFIDRGGNCQIGWYINPKLITTHLMIIYNDDDSQITKSTQDLSIHKLHCLLVDKDKLRNMVQCKYHKTFDDGLTRTEIFAKVKECGEYKNGNIRIKQSSKLREQPINLIIQRSDIEEIADKIWIF